MADYGDGNGNSERIGGRRASGAGRWKTSRRRIEKAISNQIDFKILYSTNKKEDTDKTI